MKVNTNNPEIRERRLENQLIILENLEELFGLPHQDRLDSIREDLFTGIDNVRGDKPREFRSVNLKFDAPEGNRVYEYQVATTWLIDALHRELDTNSDPITQTMRVFRFSSIQFSLGVTVHPYRDGNSQTHRINCLSHLRENCVDLRDATLTLKREYGRLFIPALDKTRLMRLQKNENGKLYSRIHSYLDLMLFSEVGRSLCEEYIQFGNKCEYPGMSVYEILAIESFDKANDALIRDIEI